MTLPEGMARCESCGEPRHEIELVQCTDCQYDLGMGKARYCKTMCAKKCASCEGMLCEFHEATECRACRGPSDAELYQNASNY